MAHSSRLLPPAEDQTPTPLSRLGRGVWGAGHLARLGVGIWSRASLGLSERMEALVSPLSSKVAAVFTWLLSIRSVAGATEERNFLFNLISVNLNSHKVLVASARCTRSVDAESPLVI